MKPTDETIEKFQKIYFEEFGKEISKEEAHENFLSLVNVLEIILRAAPELSQGCEDPGPVLSAVDEVSENDKLEKNKS